MLSGSQDFELYQPFLGVRVGLLSSPNCTSHCLSVCLPVFSQFFFIEKSNAAVCGETITQTSGSSTRTVTAVTILNPEEAEGRSHYQSLKERLVCRAPP